MPYNYYQPRIPVRFESLDSVPVVLTFPLAGYSVDMDQGMDTPEEQVAGLDGSWDGVGLGAAALRPIIVNLSFEAYEDEPEDVDAVIDELNAKMHNIGLGKLWTVGRDSGGNDVERWSYFRATSKPRTRWRAGDSLRKQAVCQFRGGPYWFGDTAYTWDETITSSPVNVVLDVPGNAPAWWMVMRLRSNSSAGFEDVDLWNLTNGYRMTGTRNAGSADDEMRIDTERQVFEFSDDDGATYADDYASWSIGDTQVALFRLEPGENTVQVTCAGTPNFDFEGSLYPAWE